MKKEIILNEGQRTAVEKGEYFFANSNERIFTLLGYAGTGKTTIASRFVDMAKVYCPWSSTVCIAPTNTAVRRLSTRTDAEYYSTVFALIYGKFDPRVPEEKRVPLSLENNSSFFLDEASMIGYKNWNDLSGKLEESNSRIVIIGDIGQLEPIDKGPNRNFNLLAINDRSPRFTHTLTQVMRNDTDVLKAATFIRNNNGIFTLPRIPGSDSYVVFENNNTGFRNAILDKVHANEEFIILTTSNVGRVNVNKWIRQEKYGKNKSKHVVLNDETLIVINNKGYYKNGDIVNLNKVVVNRDMFIEVRDGQEIKQVIGNYIETDKGAFLLLPDWIKSQASFYDIVKMEALGEDIYIDTSSLSIATYGYCITVHKSQGNEWDNVFIAIEDTMRFNKQKLYYTAITRAKKNTYINIK